MSGFEKDVLRILDANFNRSREGLRVCEEITRFLLNDQSLTRALKEARHAVSEGLKKLPVSQKELLSSRNVREDVGRESSALENERKGAVGLFLANIQRAKEALRVLEETSKLVDVSLPPKIKKIRFNVYAIEKRTLPKLEALCDHGSRGSGKQVSRRGRARRH